MSITVSKTGWTVLAALLSLTVVMLSACTISTDGGSKESYTLSVASTSGGSVTTPGQPSSTYGAGAIVDLVAVADEGYHFVNWTGDVTDIADVSSASSSITMNDNYSITANFALDTYDSSGYFPITPGYGIEYHVTDTCAETPVDCNVWAIFQDYVTDKPSPLDFVVTLVKDGATAGDYCPSALGGEMSHRWGDTEFTGFYIGMRVENQGWFYMNFQLLSTFTYGDQWTYLDSPYTRTYTVNYHGSETISSNAFDNCIRVTVEDFGNKNPYDRGSGYFIVAPDVGIIKLMFNRTDGTSVSYEYVDSTEFTGHPISGTVIDGNNGGASVQGIYVGIACADWGSACVTDSNGSFLITAYGRDVILRVWYDRGDGHCDPSRFPVCSKDYYVTVDSDPMDVGSIDISQPSICS